MKTIKILVVLALFLNIGCYGQKGHRDGRSHGHHHGKVVAFKRSVYHPKKIVVYHPYWRPNHAYNRRWVFFPKYNIYWDNWRNHYVFWNGTIWVSQPAPPPVIVNVNLGTEKQYEMKENEDDEDDVYKSNDKHKTEYKPE